MGTTYSVKINAVLTEDALTGIRTGIAGVLSAVDRKMSTYLPESELSKINSNKSSDWQPVSADLYRVLEQALYISDVTNGAFDVTIGPLVNLWGFGPAQHDERIPPDDEIRTELENTGYRNIELRTEPQSVLKKIPDIYIDLSGIAKGYAVDKVAEYLENSAYTDFMVEIGGEIRARGQNASGQPWNIGIEKPEPRERSVQRATGLRDMSMATSGDYRNFFEIDGVRYSHTIDPRTGRPVSHNLVSVTVLDPSASIADATATGLLVLGPEQAKQVAENHDIAAYMIIKTGTGFIEVMTSAFSRYLNDVNSPGH